MVMPKQVDVLSALRPLSSNVTYSKSHISKEQLEDSVQS